MKALLVTLMLVPATAVAFPTGEQFDLDALKEDGAGGIAFDGAPRFSGHTCAVCHTETPGRIGITLQGDKPALFTDGWTPNTTYHLRVVIDNAWAAALSTASGDNCGINATPYKRCDENGFALEMADRDGKPVGKFAVLLANQCTVPAPGQDVNVRVMTDGTAITHSGAHNGVTSWDFCWTAPAAGAGVVTAFIAAVDGNGGDGTENFPSDTIGDDVASGTVPMPESGVPAPPQTGGCDAAGTSGIGVLIALLALRRRNRMATLLLLASLSGCVHVRARQRATLAHRNMRFAPDPAEDELDLHMQEAREGSSGGYGSSGGGCGCN
jgi:uncharacterized protein (TIGR03382 family)